MYLIKISFILLFVISFSYAETKESIPINSNENISLKEKEMDPVLGFLLIEGLIATNAWMASEDPNLYGGVCVFLFPLGAGNGSENTTKTTLWTSFIGAESIAIYNWSINADKKSKSKIFKENMVLWHLFMGAVGMSEYLTKNLNLKNETVFITPTIDEGFRISYNYTF